MSTCVIREVNNLTSWKQMLTNEVNKTKHRSDSYTGTRTSTIALLNRAESTIVCGPPQASELSFGGYTLLHWFDVETMGMFIRDSPPSFQGLHAISLSSLSRHYMLKLTK
jgi:hypothetical protein